MQRIVSIAFSDNNTYLKCNLATLYLSFLNTGLKMIHYFQIGQLMKNNVFVKITAQCSIKIFTGKKNIEDTCVYDFMSFISLYYYIHLCTIVLKHKQSIRPEQ